MLHAKAKVQADLREYLNLRHKLREAQKVATGSEESSQENSEQELARRFAALGRHLPDAGKAAACMEKVHAMKVGLDEYTPYTPIVYRYNTLNTLPTYHTYAPNTHNTLHNAPLLHSQYTPNIPPTYT